MILLARIKEFLARHMLVMEFCHDCGRRVDQVWTCGDTLWAELVQANGPLCIGCFDERAVTTGLLMRWIPRVEHRRAMVPRG